MERSGRTPFYNGPALLELLESMPADSTQADRALRLPVQLVIRPQSAAAEGLTTEEIASRLYISPSTVKTHLHSAQDRVGARNRVHLAVLAERAGLLG